MPDVSKSTLAEQDLVDIWLYGFQKWGEVQADAYLDELNGAAVMLADNPMMCRERKEFVPAVRIHHHARHLIVYLATDEGIRMVRVLHDRMELNKQLNIE